MSRTMNRRIAAGLEDIGLTAIERQDARGFLASVDIRNGEIHYRPDAPPSNILHEAGHLACIPPAFRPYAHGGLSRALAMMIKASERRMEETGDPDDPLVRAIMQCSDPEATAWAWAFGVKMGIPPKKIILDTEYDGTGHILRLQLSTSGYAGINGLRAAGMIGSTKDYPRLSKWLQDVT